MNCKRLGTPGFSLIEVVVYCALASLVVVVVLGWLTVVFQAIATQGRISARLIAASLVVDAVTRDLRSASREPADWDPAEGVFTKRTVDAGGKAAATHVAWAVEGGIVRRFEGDYNFTTHRWTKQTASIVGRDGVSLSIVPVWDAERRYVVRVVVAGRWGECMAVNQTVALGNRELP